MKKYTLRINLELLSNSDNDVKRQIANYIKELPRMEGVSYSNASLYNTTDKRMVDSEIK